LRPRPQVFRFVYDRRDGRLAEIDPAQFRARIPGREPEDNSRLSRSGEQNEWIGRAANGAEYRSRVKYCGEGLPLRHARRRAVLLGEQVAIPA
jgi:hypothetical protein